MKLAKPFLLGVVLALVVSGCASRLPEDELRSARKRLEHCLFNEAMTQSEMTILSNYQLQLANMEKYMIEFRIWNQPGYSAIEKEFLADCEAWDKQARIEAAKPSEFEGGSMAPMEHNLRMAAFYEKRIEALKNRWQKK